jgi:Raf kinase inhibitor-like YbhB/YbcL family protein
MKLRSSAFEPGGKIPRRYGHAFDNVNPPLTIEDVPPGTAALALIMDDPDLPAGARVAVWDHWLVFDIPPGTGEIPEGWEPTGLRGSGSGGDLAYMGPRPPDREHRYFFHLYALDKMLDLPEGSPKRLLLDAMDGHTLATAELMGRYAPEGN